MSSVSRRVEASPAQVYAVLADGWAYSNWVTGTSHIRAVEADWPCRGQQAPPRFGDLARRRSRRDRGREGGARGASRPDGALEGRSARPSVSIRLTAEGADTRVDLIETPSAGLGKWLDNPLTESLLARRNVESLARLAALAERRTEP